MPPVVLKSVLTKLVAGVILSTGMSSSFLQAEETPALLPVVSLGDAISLHDYNVAQTLKKWAQTSTLLQPIPDVKRREIERRLKPIHTGHQISLIVALSGPLEEKTLKDNFEWTLETTITDKTILVATPKEKLEHLFNGNIRIELDRESLPTSVSFTGSKPLTSSNEIQLTGYRQTAPVVFPKHIPIRSAVYTLEAPTPIIVPKPEPRRMPAAEAAEPVE